MRYLISAMLIIVGIIHVLPLSGVFGSERLSTLYGLSFTDPNLVILMRHRAVLFGILGMFFLFAAFNPPSQTVAFIAGFISVVSFLWLAFSIDGYNPHIARVFLLDIIALVCLIIGLAAQIYLRNQR